VNVNSPYPVQSPKQQPDPPVLQVSGLSYTYNGNATRALQDLDLTVRAGEIFGLLGPNGAGKTTAISIMSTLMRPLSGRLSICGLDALRYPRRVRPYIGVVPQRIALFETLTASENLTYFGRLYGLRGHILKEAVRSGLRVAGLEDRARQSVSTFSGGMKRRVNLAAGILHRPRLLFLDEPTVGIDAQSRNQILENLLLLRERGITIIYTTHYMEEVQRVCSRLAIIDRGRIVVQDRTERLIHQHTDCADLGELYLKLTGRQLRD
jgi:ABC-2 type transport system ATP-binding protein